MALDSIQPLRTAIVNFHQNMRILYNDLYQASGSSQTNKVIFDLYHPLLDNIRSAGVFGATFTLDDVQEHIRYLIGIIRPLASANALDQTKLQQYGEVPGAENLQTFGKHVQDTFVPLATALRVPADENELIEKAPMFSELLNKIGANIVSYVRQYVSKMSTAARSEYLLRWAAQFEEQFGR